MPAPLDGIRVVELGTTITAPLASRLLGDLGADVIKIERPGGDPFRRAPYFNFYNRNKRSLVLDLGVKTDRERFESLLQNADIFIDNVRPGVLERMGIDVDALRRRNEGLIHCSITGFGAIGPYADRPAYDAVAQAIGGLSRLLVDPDAPKLQGPTISDNVTGMYACIAMLGALNARLSTGSGARLEVNMLEATMAFIGDQFGVAMESGKEPGVYDRVAASHSFIFRCADNTLIAIHLSSQDKFWLGLIEAIGAPELAADPRFVSRSTRITNHAALRDELALRFARAPYSSWIAPLRRADVPFAPAYGIKEALADPQVRALGTAYDLEDGHGARFAGIETPILMDGHRPRHMTASPALGEHHNASFTSLKHQ